MKQNLRFLLVLGRQTVLNVSEILLKYPNLSHVFMDKTNTKLKFLYLVKVSQSQKQIKTLWILPTNEWTQDTILSVFCLFFGRIDDTLICF